jgi:hypothetical protein
MVPTDDSSLEESSAGACIATPPVMMALAVAISSLDHVFVAVVVGGDYVVVGGTNFVAATHADKEGNADVGLVDVNPTMMLFPEPKLWQGVPWRLGLW